MYALWEIRNEIENEIKQDFNICCYVRKLYGIGIVKLIYEASELYDDIEIDLSQYNNKLVYIVAHYIANKGDLTNKANRKEKKLLTDFNNIIRLYLNK